jgi:DNA-binding NarL/FixJ family response regulator
MPDQSAPTIKVVVIEDQRVIREGLEALIGGTEGYACSGAFRSIEEALARPWTDIPDVDLVDIRLPGMSGIEGLRLLREKYPSTVLVMLS